MQLRMHVDNIMATLDTGVALDVQKLGTLKNRKGKPAPVGGSFSYRLKDQMTSVQFYPTGKVVFTSSDLLGLYESRDIVIDDLAEVGYVVNDDDIIIDNIVASGDFKRKLDLDKLHLLLGIGRTEYEPEQFPGLVCHLDEPKATILLFNNGKIICTGANTPDEINEAANTIMRCIEQIDAQ